MSQSCSTKDLVKEFFTEELTSLRLGGRALASSHPHLAHALASESSDPDIERLLAGVAYIAAQMRVHNQACMPELTLALCERIAPELTHPIASSALCQLSPKDNQREPLAIPKHERLVRKTDRGNIIFSTRQDIVLSPVTHLEFFWKTDARGGGELHLEFPSHLLQHSTDSNQSSLITIWLNDVAHVAQDVLFALLFHSVKLSCLASNGAWEGPSEVLSCPLMDGVTHTWPDPCEPEWVPHNALPRGLRLWRNWHNLPPEAQFLTIDLQALLKIAPLQTRHEGIQSFTLVINVSDAVNLPAVLPKDFFQLNIVAVDNLFLADADPLRVDAHASAQPMRPQGHSPESIHVVSVEQASLLAPHSGRRTTLPAAGMGHQTPSGRSYTITRRANPVDGWHDAQLQLIHPQDAPPLREEHVVSARLWCTQRRSAELIAPGPMQTIARLRAPFEASMVTASSRAQDVVACQNGSSSADPWRLAGLIPGRLQRGLCLASLREVLSAAISFAPDDHASQRQAQRRIDAIEDLKLARKHRPWRASAIPTRQIILTINMSLLAGPGEAFLLAAFVDQVLSDGQGLGEAHEVVFILTPQQQRYCLATRCDGMLLSKRMRLTGCSAA